MIQTDYDTWARIDAKFKQNQEVKLEAPEAPIYKANTSVLITAPQALQGEPEGASEQTQATSWAESFEVETADVEKFKAAELAGQGYQSNLPSGLIGFEELMKGPIYKQFTKSPLTAAIVNQIGGQFGLAFAGQDEERCSLFVPREEFDRLSIRFWEQSQLVNALLRRVAALEMKIGSQE